MNTLRRLARLEKVWTGEPRGPDECRCEIVRVIRPNEVDPNPGVCQRCGGTTPVRFLRAPPMGSTGKPEVWT